MASRRLIAAAFEAVEFEGHRTLLDPEADLTADELALWDEYAAIWDSECDPPDAPDEWFDGRSERAQRWLERDDEGVAGVA